MTWSRGQKYERENLYTQDGSRESLYCLSTMAKKSSSKNPNPQRKRGVVEDPTKGSFDTTT